MRRGASAAGRVAVTGDQRKSLIPLRRGLEERGLRAGAQLQTAAQGVREPDAGGGPVPHAPARVPVIIIMVTPARNGARGLPGAGHRGYHGSRAAGPRWRRTRNPWRRPFAGERALSTALSPYDGGQWPQCQNPLFHSVKPSQGFFRCVRNYSSHYIRRLVSLNRDRILDLQKTPFCVL